MDITELKFVILTSLSGTKMNSFAGLKGVGHDVQSNKVEGSYATILKKSLLRVDINKELYEQNRQNIRSWAPKSCR